MRSSKSRSRSKSNRPRPLGNVINRVFDSSGPDGKVRGTPQQIIDKYLVLARDAQLSNDRVAAENFLQHAEHYTRVLAEAQAEVNREAEARREAQEAQARQQQEAQARRAAQGRGDNDGGGGDGRAQQDGRQAQDNRNRNRKLSDNGNDGGAQDDTPRHHPAEDASSSRASVDDGAPRTAAEVIDIEGEADAGLVDTPESRKKKPTRKPRARAGQEGDQAHGGEEKTGAEADKPAPKRRSPRKPKPAAENAAADPATKASEEQHS